MPALFSERREHLLRARISSRTVQAQGEGSLDDSGLAQYNQKAAANVKTKVAAAAAAKQRFFRTGRNCQQKSSCLEWYLVRPVNE